MWRDFKILVNLIELNRMRRVSLPFFHQKKSLPLLLCSNLILIQPKKKHNPLVWYQKQTNFDIVFFFRYIVLLSYNVSTRSQHRKGSTAHNLQIQSTSLPSDQDPFTRFCHRPSPTSCPSIRKFFSSLSRPSFPSLPGERGHPARLRLSRSRAPQTLGTSNPEVPVRPRAPPSPRRGPSRRGRHNGTCFSPALPAAPLPPCVSRRLDANAIRDHAMARPNRRSGSSYRAPAMPRRGEIRRETRRIPSGSGVLVHLLT